MEEIPYGYCKCGCGQKTTISKYNMAKYGYTKGQPKDYVRGHAHKVNPLDTRVKVNWKYADYVQAGLCPSCKTGTPKEGMVLCERCWTRRNKPEAKAKQTELVRRYKKSNREKGLCDRCKNPIQPGYKECPECKRRAFERRRAMKQAVIDKYGGKCTCCGEHRFEFLTIDHVYNNGAEHRREVKQHVYGAVLREPKSDQYQLLCMNCNFAKGKYGYCPHEVEQK